MAATKGMNLTSLHTKATFNELIDHIVLIKIK